MPIFVSFTAPQDYVVHIRENQAKQELEADAYSSDGTIELSSGKLTFINNQVDTTTGTIQLKATFENDDKRLWPGEFVNIRLIVARHDNAVTVPAETVMQGPNGPYVYVIRSDQTVEHRDVQVLSTQDGIAAIEKGLKAGEPVVVNGQLRLADGAKIVAVQQSANGDSAGPAP
jgi:multidrug efflux system membrane fusion protein